MRSDSVIDRAVSSSSRTGASTLPGDQPRQPDSDKERAGSNRRRDPHGRVDRGTLAVHERRGDEHIPRRARCIDCNVTGAATRRTVPADV